MLMSLDIYIIWCRLLFSARTNASHVFFFLFVYRLILAEIYILYIYLYKIYSIYIEVIWKKKKVQSLLIVFPSFINVPKFIMSDYIVLHLNMELAIYGREHVKLFTNCWGKFCIKSLILHYSSVLSMNLREKGSSCEMDFERERFVSWDGLEREKCLSCEMDSRKKGLSCEMDLRKVCLV